MNLAQDDGLNYVKDLSKIGRLLSNTIIVDTKPENFGWHLQNGICIQEFVGDERRSKLKKETDHSLEHLSKLLKAVHTQATEL